MKKIKAILICIFFNFTHAFSQKYETKIEYKTKQGDTSNFHVSNKKEFNTLGLLIKEVQYEDNTILNYRYIDTFLTIVEKQVDGEIIEIEKYSYNTNRKLIKTEVEKKGIAISKDTFVYDSHGYLIEEIHYFEDETAEKTIYVNDKSGKNIIETEWQLNEDDIWEKTCSSRSKWNEKGEIIEWRNSECNPARNPHETWSWDDKSRIIKHQTFTRDRKLYREDVYTYYEGGYQIISTGFNYDGSVKHLNTKTWEYQPQFFTYCKTDSVGRLIEERVIDEKKELISLRIFRYDNYGNLLQEIYCNSDGTLNYSNKYEYN